MLNMDKNSLCFGLMIGRQIAGQRTSKNEPSEEWETILEDTITTAEDRYGIPNGECTLMKKMAYTGTYRMTVDGESYILTAGLYDKVISPYTYIGNLGVYEPDYEEDTGLDFFMMNYNNGFYSRNSGTYHVRIEKKLGAYNRYDQCKYNDLTVANVPEYDKEKYPYLAIGAGGKAFLWACASKKPFVRISDKVFSNNDAAPCLTCDHDFWALPSMDGTTWNDWAVSEGENINFESIKWANHDILNEDGTVYLAASEPVPIT